MTCQCCLHSFLNYPFKRAKSGCCLKVKVHPLTPEELKAHPHWVQRVSVRALKVFQGLQGLRGLRVQQVFQDKVFQGYQEHQAPLVHKDTQELENLDCLVSQGNQGVLDYLDQKGNLV